MGSIKNNILYSSILTTANYIFPLIVFPYISRVLGVTKIGICNFIDSIINYYILFSMMGISIVGIREVSKCRHNREQLNITFTSLLTLNFIATAIVCIILIISIYTVPKLYDHKELMFIGVTKLVFNCLLIEWLYKGLEEFRYITTRTIIIKSIYVILVFIFVRSPNDYIKYYGLLVGMTVINAIVNFIYANKYVSFSFKPINLKVFVKPFFILGVYQLLTSMYTSFNVAYLGFSTNETQVGLYTTATKLYTIVLALFTAFTGVLLPRMSSLISENKLSEFKILLKKSIDVLLAFSFPVIILCTIMAPQIILLIAGPGYEGAIVPMRIIMPLVFIVGYEQVLIKQVLMPLSKDDIILKNSTYGAIAGLLLNILIVPHLHSLGSSLVWLLSELIVLLSAQYFISKDYNILFPFNGLFHNFVANIPLIVLVLCISKLNCQPFVQVCIAGIVTFVYSIIIQVVILKNNTIATIIARIRLPH